MIGVSAERRAELAAALPVGGRLDITEPWPVGGLITEHSDHGLLLTRSETSWTFVSWTLLDTATVVVETGGTP